MGNIRVLAALFAFAAAASAQSGTAILEGRLIGTSGGPVTKTVVRVAPTGRETGPSYFETSDHRGRFRIEGIAPGGYDITTSGNFIRTGNDTTVRLAAGQTLKHEVRLQPLLTVSGKVVDRDGDPVPNATVSILGFRLMDGARTSDGTTTNLLGEFIFSPVLPGDYYLAARGDTGIPSPQAGDLLGPGMRKWNLITYYPNAADQEHAKLIHVEQKHVTGRKIELLHGPAYIVRGSIGGLPDADALNHLLVMVASSRGQRLPIAPPSIRHAPSGFEIGPLPPGKYSLEASIPSSTGPGSSIVGRTSVAIVDRDVNGVTIPLGKVSVSGRVTIEGVTDTSAFIAELWPPRGIPRLPGAPALGVSIQGRDGPPARGMFLSIDNDGNFRDDISPGRYQVRTAGPQSMFVKWVRWNGELVPDLTVDLSTSGGTLEVHLSATGSLHLLPPEVPEGASDRKFAFVLWPADPEALRKEGSVRIAPARYPPERFRLERRLPSMRFPDLEPGDYYAVFFQGLPDVAFSVRLKDLARFNSIATRVTLRVNQDTDVRLNLITPEQAQRILKPPRRDPKQR